MTLFENSLSPLGFGTSKLRSLNGGVSRRAAQRLLEHAFQLGVRFVDTAPSYGQGQAESAIGGLPARIKNELVLCSKAGYSYGRKAAVINAVKPLLQPVARSFSLVKRTVQRSRDQLQRHGSISIDIMPDSIRASLQGTLRRLGRDNLDVLLLHDPNVESLNDENCNLLDALTREGLIRKWGVSTGEAQVARRAVELENLTVLQVPVYPAWVSQAGDLFASCAARGIAVVANRVLFSIDSQAQPGALRHQDTHGLIGECFRFALAQPGVRVVLCGTTNAAHLAANAQTIEQLLGSAAAD